MSNAETTDRFVAALHALERDRDVTTIAGLFDEDSEIGNVVSPRDFRGREGAREFWEAYRHWFGEIESTFRNVIVSDGRAALEWTTTGSSASGDPITYDGVSILEMTNGRITRFRAYFDPGGLGEQMHLANAGAAEPGAE
jgi:ketosteroid isomerase-like protein